MNLDKFTKSGKFLMLALDHRGSFKKLMNPQNPDLITDDEVIALKSEIIDSLKDQFSGLLIDETYGLGAYSHHNKPFLLPLEKSGYTDQAGERITEVEYRVTQLITYGASGGKLLLYFNPHISSANRQIETARKVLQQCKESHFPLFLEIVVYEIGNDQERLNKDRPELVLSSLRMLIENAVVPNVWKLEYPGSGESCHKITQLVGKTPWILLTRGDTFDVFKEELKVAIKSGAVGFLAGRALWQEVCTMQGTQKEEFLTHTLPERFKIISKIALDS